MRIWKRILLIILLVIGIGLTFVAPLVTAYFKIFTIIPQHHVINVVWLFLAGAFSLVYIKFIKKRVRERLTARATVEELGIQGATNPVIIRVIKALELVFPLITLGLTMFIITLIPGTEILTTAMWLLGYVLSGQIIFGVHDYIKWIWLIEKEAMHKYKVEKQLTKIKTRLDISIEED